MNYYSVGQSRDIKHGLRCRVTQNILIFPPRGGRYSSTSLSSGIGPTHAVVRSFLTLSHSSPSWWCPPVVGGRCHRVTTNGRCWTGPPVKSPSGRQMWPPADETRGLNFNKVHLGGHADLVLDVGEVRTGLGAGRGSVHDGRGFAPWLIEKVPWYGSWTKIRKGPCFRLRINCGPHNMTIKFLCSCPHPFPPIHTISTPDLTPSNPPPLSPSLHPSYSTVVPPPPSLLLSC